MIYARGVDYFNNKKISNLSLDKVEDSDRHVLVSGEVSGKDIYVGNFIFDLKKNIFLDHRCDCPYNDFCKHTVTLALEFIEHYLGKKLR